MLHCNNLRFCVGIACMYTVCLNVCSFFRSYMISNGIHLHSAPLDQWEKTVSVLTSLANFISTHFMIDVVVQLLYFLLCSVPLASNNNGTCKYVILLLISSSFEAGI